MNNKALLQSLKDSKTFKEWVKNPERLKLLPCDDRRIVLAHDKAGNKHYLYVFMLFGENNWQCSVDVSEGSAEDVIERIFVRLSD